MIEPIVIRLSAADDPNMAEILFPEPPLAQGFKEWCATHEAQPFDAMTNLVRMMNKAEAEAPFHYAKMYIEFMRDKASKS